MKKILYFIKKETVLSIAVVLAVISVFFVVPDREYISYIDFRTLAILFCLMSIVAGLRNIDVFDKLAERLLSKVHGIGGVTVILVCLCFFMSMFITNDVSLITFVPFAIIIMKKLNPDTDSKWMLKVIVMQTIAANLGSMLTPLGNPQNLYLYGKAGIGIAEFLKIMLPYTVCAFALLMAWIGLASMVRKRKLSHDGKTEIKQNKGLDSVEDKASTKRQKDSLSASGSKWEKKDAEWIEKFTAYLILFVISLLAVSHILPYGVPFALVFLYLLLRDRKILTQVDYSLLCIFIALFIFIGNLGRIPAFSQLLSDILTGREVVTSVIASQVMSNVPAAILLSGFTDHIRELVIGTNLGGLGTLIASMASLISFKYVAKEDRSFRGRYFLEFTVANVIFLFIMMILYCLLS
ncbi:citrate transporter [Clostridium sp. OM05-9]|jgi:Na+/H+ antiporter NhaD/arsenite permease-like protein|uniref:SLC13 family permease n=1 Tax=Clostridium sp. OM05-9 TaxID=2293045 RepID=UPI000E491D74|nr:SLC13 family permease [Clostridium sp. OM05-9]RHV14071.1 citrate transporter [Clostridium sp. OM05-9]